MILQVWSAQQHSHYVMTDLNLCMQKKGSITCRDDGTSQICGKEEKVHTETRYW